VDPRTAELIAQRRKPGVSSRLWRAVRVGEAGIVWIKKHRLVTGLTLALSFVLFASAYQMQIERPAELRAKTEFDARTADRVKAEIANRSDALDGCLTKAKEEADARWTAACKREGKRAGCYLSREQTFKLQGQESSARNGCLLKYPHAQ
jgi:hypothetical protein